MKKKLLILQILLSVGLLPVAAQTSELAGLRPEVVVTPYKTTMVADGKDKAQISITVIDKQGKDITDATNLISFKITGDAKIISLNNKYVAPNNAGLVPDKLVNGKINMVLQAGTRSGVVKLDALSDGLTTGSTEIHTVHPGIAHPVTKGPPITGNTKITSKIIGADISFLPQLESRGMKFYDQDGKEKDAIKILKEHGFNYIRLRIFNHPEVANGYSPQKGFCDLQHTLQMAKRIKTAGLKFLLDFHYSDTWADPQRQNVPAVWSKLDFNTLKDSLYQYTKTVIQTLKAQGTAPDMVQVGNEINHGMVWPNGEINNLDSLATLIYAGVKAVKEVNPATTIMVHIALGGQNAEAHFFLDNIMVKRKVPFDVIGLSYYPKWHGTTTDLKNNMTDLATHYKKYVMVAEYSQLKQEVNDIAFTAPGNRALGSFIWEPLNTWEAVFDKNGKANKYLEVYPAIAKKYNVH